MGFTPLIPDDQHTCRMPADVDEDAFVPKSAVLPQPVDQLGASNFSYFVQKCKSVWSLYGIHVLLRSVAVMDYYPF
jgi:hypothetical protein